MGASAPLVALLVALAWVCWPARPGRHAQSADLPPSSSGVHQATLGVGPGASDNDADEVTSGQVAAAMLLLGLALRGTSSIGQAIREVGALLPGPAGRELIQVAAALEWGRSDDDAWARVSPLWAPVSESLRLARLAGVAPAAALQRAAEELRRDLVAGLEERCAQAGVRLVLPLGLAFLPAFCLLTVVPLVAALFSDLAA